MLEALLKKLETITALTPNEENESLIRQLSHSLINELRMYSDDENASQEERILKRCFSHIETLNRRLIMTKPYESYAFSSNDLGYTVGNCVIACDTLLSGSDNILTFQAAPGINCVFSRKLITKAVTLLTELLSCDSGSFIEFHLKRLDGFTVLSAFKEQYNHGFTLSDGFYENISVLTKIAYLHSGTCVWSINDTSAYIAISISENLKPNAKAEKSPSYIDLLIDKTSDIYIGLSHMENLHTRS